MSATAAYQPSRTGVFFERPLAPSSSGAGDERIRELKNRLAEARIHRPVERVQWLNFALADFLEEQAASSTNAMTLSLASGFKSFVSAVNELDGACTESTKEAMGTFVSGWLVAIIAERVTINQPGIEQMADASCSAIHFTWKRDDRTLEVRISDSDSHFLASWFTPSRELRLQEGALELSDEALRKTVSWLVSGSV